MGRKKMQSPSLDAMFGQHKEEQKTTRTYQLSKETIRALDRYAADIQKQKSEIVEEALERFLPVKYYE